MRLGILTNSFFGARLGQMNLGRSANPKSKQKTRVIKKDPVAEGVKKVLSDSNQKLILMVRG